MGRKKKVQVDQRAVTNPDWEVTDASKVNGRIVTAGTELTIKGIRGRFRFIEHVKTPKTEWINVVGGQAGYRHFRAFRPEQIRTVHYKNRMRENAKHSKDE